jgi:protein TonB
MLSNLSFTLGQVLGALFAGLLAITGLILFARRHFELKSREDLHAKYKGKQWASPLTARNKYPDVNVFQWQPTILKLGVVLALGICFGIFNITSAPQNTLDGGFQLSVDEDVEIEVPRSQEAPPPPPPPPPPTVQEVSMVDVIDENEEINFVDQSVDANSAITAVAPQARDRNMTPPPPPPPPTREDDVKEIFVVVEEMPRFPGCEDFPGDQKAKKACADAKLMEFIYSNIHYPAVARENGVEGNVVVQFVVNTDGSVTDLQVLRDIGAGCGEEALRVVNMMNILRDKWIPGKQRGRPVRVMFTLPVRFKLQYN